MVLETGTVRQVERQQAIPRRTGRLVQIDSRTAAHGRRRLLNATRNSWCAIIFLAAAALIASVPLHAQQRVRVGIYDNSPKIGFSESGKPEGIFVDLLDAIAAKEGWSIEYVPGTWGEGLDRLRAGTIDLMPDVALTPERQVDFAFHREPVLSSWNQVYARKGSGIRSLPDLAGRRVAVVRGSVQEDLFRQMVGAFGFNVVLVPQPDFAASFRAVAESRADAVVTNRFYGARHATAAGLEDTAIIFAPSRLFFAAPRRGNVALLAAIDRHLLAFKSDTGSVYYRSLRKWATDEPRPAVPRWVFFAALATLALLAIAAAWLILLRREVSIRTAIIRRLYDEAREHAGELELRVAERTRELADAKHSAEAADRIKSAFLATMSHELRTPLNSIIGFTGIVCQELAGPLNDEQKRQLGMVRESAQHLLALINDVLDISKIEAGELTVGADFYDLPTSIRKVARIVGPLAEKKGLSLTVDVSDGVGEMVGDARRVEQILLNLLGNAIKFTESGSVKLTVEPVSDAAAPAVRLSVADTGIGIKPEDMEQLFLPFRQIDSTISRKHEGTGLGLAICRRLAALMGGRIEAESRWGEGSVFTLLLPVRSDIYLEAS